MGMVSQALRVLLAPTDKALLAAKVTEPTKVAVAVEVLVVREPMAPQLRVVLVASEPSVTSRVQRFITQAVEAAATPTLQVVATQVRAAWAADSRPCSTSSRRKSCN